MITAETRQKQLTCLTESLRRIVSILRLDDSCQWRGHFENQLAIAEQLVADGFTQDQLAELSSSICFVFSGMGSFNDYFPGKYDAATGCYTPLPGSEDFDAVSHAVAEQAFELRVIGNR
jgi:hypothetical protein